jgi:hypothetical protein
LAKDEQHVAGHSNQTFMKYYNESARAATQKLIQSIEKKTGGVLDVRMEVPLETNLNMEMAKRLKRQETYNRRERTRRRFFEEEIPLNPKYPMANKEKFRFIMGVSALEPGWIKSLRKGKREEFMWRTLLLSLKPEGEQHPDNKLGTAKTGSGFEWSDLIWFEY